MSHSNFRSGYLAVELNGERQVRNWHVADCRLTASCPTAKITGGRAVFGASLPLGVVAQQRSRPHLAAVRPRTSTMRLGVGVVLAPIDHPLHIVQRMATLDIPSHGRVDVGLGREVLHTLHHFGEHVIPHFREKEPRAAVA